MSSTFPRLKMVFFALAVTNAALVYALNDQRQQVQDFDAQIDRQLSLTAELSDRLEGLGSDKPELTVDPADYWAGSDDAELSRSLQSFVLASTQDRDLGLQVFRPHPSEERSGWMRISATVEIEGKLASVISLVDGLQTHSPPLVVEELSVRPVPNRQQESGDTTVYARLLLWGATATESGER